MKIESSNYKFRHLGRVIIENTTPLAVGIGEKDIISDSLIATDVNELPYIPGTSIAGVVRSMLDPKKEQCLFGYQKGDKGRGSEIVFTEAKMLNSHGQVVDGIDAMTDDPLCQACKHLPIRQHVRINGKGTTDKSGKFDEQIVYAGMRFCFEFEILSKEFCQESFAEVIKALCSPEFRIGSGSRSGFGKIDVVKIQHAKLDLSQKEHLTLYIDKSSNLNKEWKGWTDYHVSSERHTDVVEYMLTLKPEDFFMFGSGFGDSEGNADMTGIRASRVVWANDDSASIQPNNILIPASSLKGALRHRVAYHYNRLTHAWVGTDGAKEADKNAAVIALFGTAEGDGVRGKVLMSDIIKSSDVVKTKYINHVAIDRFTGGSIDGALFTEQADYGRGETFETSIIVNKEAFKQEKVKEALECALDDIIEGRLPLGGGVNRGNGIFTGSKTIKE